jgi:hypothetical protein
MDAPFLELAFYVGIDKASDALTAVISRKVSHGPARGSSRIIGLGDHEEEVLSVGGTFVVHTKGTIFVVPLV